MFDVVLGSELAYGWFGRKFADELLRTVDRSLARGGSFILSYCARGSSDDGPAFSAHVPLLAAAEELGFGAEIQTFRAPLFSAQVLVVRFRREADADQRASSIAVALDAMETAGKQLNASLRELDLAFVQEQVRRDENEERLELAREAAEQQRRGKRPTPFQSDSQRIKSRRLKEPASTTKSNMASQGMKENWAVVTTSASDSTGDCGGFSFSFD
eukprot:COSAG05_NODE_3388_length_2091_cov_1.236948_3_plen_215_part_00